MSEGVVLRSSTLSLYAGSGLLREEQNHNETEATESMEINSWYDFYLSYLRACEEYNTRTDRDPHHDAMEWNHRLPKAIFGEWAIGEWLLRRQHAVATALQTLAFEKCVLCGWHIELLPGWLWELCRPYYQSRSRRNGKVGKPGNGFRTYELGVGIFTIESASKAKETLKRLHMDGKGMCDKERPGYYEDKRRAGAIGGALRAAQMRETMTGFCGQTRGEKVAAGKKGGAKVKELGLGVCGLSEEDRSLNGKRGASTTNRQVWLSTYDGLISNAGCVARHNRRVGAPEGMRVRLPEELVRQFKSLPQSIRVDRAYAVGLVG